MASLRRPGMASGEPVVTRMFDPTAEETVFFPRLVGG